MDSTLFLTDTFPIFLYTQSIFSYIFLYHLNVLNICNRIIKLFISFLFIIIIISSSSFNLKTTCTTRNRWMKVCQWKRITFHVSYIGHVPNLILTFRNCKMYKLCETGREDKNSVSYLRIEHNS